MRVFEDAEGRKERTMSATGAAIQGQRVRLPGAALVSIVLAFAVVGFLAGRVTQRTIQPAPAKPAEQTLTIEGLATDSEAARAQIYQAIGGLSEQRMQSPFQSETALTKTQINEALGALTARSDVGGGVPDIRRGPGATKSG
jgi:hypothetical protein